jgi:hypothetical protein
MKPNDVYEVLKGVGATHLHHANSVTTSSTFLGQGALLSREFVEAHALKQTAQTSDDKDKKYGIWNCLFLDHVDIHERGGRKKGGNLYGPVLFRLELDVLLSLTDDDDIQVTKRNPIHWFDGEPEPQRFFASVHEVANELSFGDFDKMLVIYRSAGRIDFPNNHADIVLDDPQKNLPSGQSAYQHALARLTEAADDGKVDVTIERRVCRSGCLCTQKYANYTPSEMNFWFT